MFGYKFVAMSSLAIALIGFLVWGHHMFPNGQSGPPSTPIFSGLTMLVAVPSAVKVWNWLATMYKGSIVLHDAHVLRLVLLLPVRHRRADGPVPGHAGDELPRPRHLFRRGPFPLHHDRRRRCSCSSPACTTGGPRSPAACTTRPLGRHRLPAAFVGFNLTFFPQFVMGTHGMPRRVRHLSCPSSRPTTSVQRRRLRPVRGLGAHGGAT